LIKYPVFSILIHFIPFLKTETDHFAQQKARIFADKAANLFENWNYIKCIDTSTKKV